MCLTTESDLRNVVSLTTVGCWFTESIAFQTLFCLTTTSCPKFDLIPLKNENFALCFRLRGLGDRRLNFSPATPLALLTMLQGVELRIFAQKDTQRENNKWRMLNPWYAVWTSVSSARGCSVFRSELQLVSKITKSCGFVGQSLTWAGFTHLNERISHDGNTIFKLISSVSLPASRAAIWTATSRRRRACAVAAAAHHNKRCCAKSHEKAHLYRISSLSELQLFYNDIYISYIVYHIMKIISNVDKILKSSSFFHKLWHLCKVFRCTITIFPTDILNVEEAIRIRTICFVRTFS